MATVMNEDQKQILAEAFNQAFEIIERNLMNTIDARFDAAGCAENIVPISEEKIREIACDEAESVVNGATIDISA